MQPGQPLLVFADVEYLQMESTCRRACGPAAGRHDAPGRAGRRRTDGASQGRADLPMADAQRHTVKVKLDLPQGMAAPGMYAKVLVPDLTAPAREAPSYRRRRFATTQPAGRLRGRKGRRGRAADDPRRREPERRIHHRPVGLAAGESILRDPPASVAAGWAPAEPRRGAEIAPAPGRAASAPGDHRSVVSEQPLGEVSDHEPAGYRPPTLLPTHRSATSNSVWPVARRGSSSTRRCRRCSSWR